MSGRKLSKDVFIVGYKRTAFGAFGGSLKDMTAVEMGAVAAKAVIANLPSADIIDSSIWGNVSQTTTDVAYLARHVALKAGVKEEAPALTVNRLCGSGFQSVVNACHEIQLDEANVVLTGGAENMSLAPYQVHGIRFGNLPFAVNQTMTDSLWETLTDKHIGCPMAITAENLSEKFDITKEQCDEFALRSQKLWAKANEEGLFKDEICPITLKTRKGEVTFDKDEHPRPSTTIEQLAKLKPLFKKGGVVSAGNASGIGDGAGAIAVASGDAVKTHGLTPISKIVSYAVCGVDPNIMGYGPVPSMNLALEKAGLTLDDMDIIEINEAFAGQFLACQKDLGFDMDKANLQGGAIAISHPTGVSGTRLTGHASLELQRTGKQYAIVSACIGGGQGIAIVLERA